MAWANDEVVTLKMHSDIGRMWFKKVDGTNSRPTIKFYLVSFSNHPCGDSPFLFESSWEFKLNLFFYVRVAKRAQIEIVGCSRV